MTFWHFTCAHGREALGDKGLLLCANDLTPADMPWPGHVVWLTDLPFPNRDGLGLTMRITTCDRTRFRYRVTLDDGIIPWTEFARDLTGSMRAELEGNPGVLVRHWYVAPSGVPVVYDPVVARSEAGTALT